METLNMDLIEALNIKYEAKFVPFSQSINKDNKDKSLNWIVTLTRNGTTLTTDYMQGIAHCKYYPQTWGKPSYKDRKLLEGCNETCETRVNYLWSDYGDRVMMPIRKENRKAKEPTLKDVLYSLILDSDVLQHESFEDWADCFGYEQDSRSAEKIYQACLTIGLKVNRMFNESERESLAEFYQDY